MQQEFPKEPKNLHPFNLFIWNYRIEIISGLLMLVGIVLSFFYIHIGGGLVGLAMGICFFKEMWQYFQGLRHFYVERGVFKTLMIIGAILYFLISIPAFVIAVFIGFGLTFFATRYLKTPQ